VWWFLKLCFLRQFHLSAATVTSCLPSFVCSPASESACVRVCASECIT